VIRNWLQGESTPVAMPGLCAGRVVAITGAGRGIGREHALLFAREGAKVVVNDLGGGADGSGASKVADEVAAEIRGIGGEATAHYEDCSTAAGAQSLVQCCVDAYGGLDTLVNNAGILRDKTLVNMSELEWDQIMQVHLKGTFLPTSAALKYWRKCATQGSPRKGRIINTSSSSGLFGNFGQSNYGAAKAGLAAFTIIANAEVERMGVRISCIAPVARTRMTLPVDRRMAKEVPTDTFDEYHPRNMSPVVVWLGSDACDVGGAVLLLEGSRVTALEGWRPGKSARKEGAAWEPAELSGVIPKIYSESEKHMMYQLREKAARAQARAKAKAAGSKL